MTETTRAGNKTETNSLVINGLFLNNPNIMENEIIAIFSKNHQYFMPQTKK